MVNLRLDEIMFIMFILYLMFKIFIMFIVFIMFMVFIMLTGLGTYIAKLHITFIPKIFNNIFKIAQKIAKQTASQKKTKLATV